MNDLTHLGEAIVRKRETLQSLQDEVKLTRETLNIALEEYDRQWSKAFERLTKESRLSWCTWCSAVRDMEFLVERYDLYSKSDNYGPVFAHTATKHRVCSQCAPNLSTKSIADSFDAMFSHDATDSLPDDETLEELCFRIKLPTRYV